MQCDTCKRQLKKKRVKEYQYKESGLPNVLLADIDVLECPSCGTQSPLIPAVARLHEALAEAIALKPEPLHGRELRFLRKQLKLSAREFARLIGVDHSTLSRWENAESFGKQSDSLVRLFYFRYIEERQHRVVEKDIIDNIARVKLWRDDGTCIGVRMPSHNPSLYSYSDDFEMA